MYKYTCTIFYQFWNSILFSFPNYYDYYYYSTNKHGYLSIFVVLDFQNFKFKP